MRHDDFAFVHLSRFHAAELFVEGGGVALARYVRQAHLRDARACRGVARSFTVALALLLKIDRQLPDTDVVEWYLLLRGERGIKPRIAKHDASDGWALTTMARLSRNRALHVASTRLLLILGRYVSEIGASIKMDPPPKLLETHTAHICTPFSGEFMLGRGACIAMEHQSIR